MIKKLFILLFSLSILSLSGHSLAASDGFLKLGEIDGESSAPGHEGEIDVLSWSWGTSHIPKAGGNDRKDDKGATSMSLNVTKFADRSSADLFLHCANGTHIREAELTVRKAGGDPLEYIKITMERVLITSVSTGASGGEDRLTENVTLNFDKVDIDYMETTPEGGVGAPVKIEYDLTKGKKI